MSLPVVAGIFGALVVRVALLGLVGAAALTALGAALAIGWMYVIRTHTVDDALPVDEARKNQQAAGVPDRICLYPGASGHAFRSQESIVAALVLAWVQTYLKSGRTFG